ncbi:hypothetical protein ACJMK2_041370 [Sinanodonta woodiana]|uniref:Uncharacterized protein n=1 Tax=Sinanodonta woodiana TaxID=1069815 RepID=A0ABD3W3X4_SINWO
MSCWYQQLTSRYKDTLNIKGERRLFDPPYDYCFCDDCCNERGDNDYYWRGEPQKKYVLPKGWRRFGVRLRLPPFETKDEVMQKGHVSFHGTLSKYVESILNVGLKTPGDTMFNGKDIVELKGHYNDDEKPEGFDTKQIFTSPSIHYAGHDAYAPAVRYYDHETRTTYMCKLAFQLRVRPGSYNVGPKTVRDSYIDRYIKDDHLEWSTKDKDAVVITGLLVKMEPCPPKHAKSYKLIKLKKNVWDNIKSCKDTKIPKI